MVSSGRSVLCVFVATVALSAIPTEVTAKVPECKTPEQFAHGFNCTSNGKCILWHGRCNGHYDCDGVDFSDEENCRPEECRVMMIGTPGPALGTYCKKDKTCNLFIEPCYGKCPPGGHKCNWAGGHETCYEERYRCDGLELCDEGEDEKGCNPEDCKSSNRFCQSDSKCISNYVQCSDGTCPVGHFPCVTTVGTKECPDLNLRCDGHRICSNGEDEANCTAEECKKGTWFCASAKTCIYPNEKCAGACQTGYTSCGDDSDVCIMNAARCDGNQDCPGEGVDEKDCRPEDCQSHAPYCADTKSCLPWTEACNGVCHASGAMCPNGPCALNYLHRKDVRCTEKAVCDDGSVDPNCTPKSCERLNITNAEIYTMRKHFNHRLEYSDVKDLGLLTLYRWCDNPGVCVPIYKKCPDGSCRPEDKPCGGGDNSCYVSKLRCDGHRDCADGADERNCAPEECSKGLHHCADQMVCKAMNVQCADGTCPQGSTACSPGICYSSRQKCNGYANCPDNSDEMGC
ncbi:LDL receptor repeat-containing protein egg-1-like [Lingula anatina]|uniref:LDL receptor repeat-containing protein egg-1-like n=1 Tax=Lingula anatina TaxID=7574 RepID=A0A1S3HY49_LINAN|nr:LDL receptor repeat-containing protein egg-1-like [Lingula anatina]|eukprot:XP_013390938.1 LDL receptor repeat-containing protein egg-1-like [Lingula anatina]